jgi:hypothetical protein
MLLKKYSGLCCLDALEACLVGPLNMKCMEKGSTGSTPAQLGGFTAERATRGSDNGDRLLPIKVSVVPLVNPRSLQGVFAYRLPALGCGWENLVSIFPFFDSLRFRVS